MGQYYTPTLINKDGVETFYSHQYHNGLKLMEHSYIGNFFVQAVVTRLLNNPSILFWMGDYAELEDISKEAAKTALFDYNVSIGKQFMSDVQNNKFDKEVIPERDFSHPNYIINHTTREYLCLDDYTNGHGFAPEEDDWVVHPLPLLTAVGNGRGGGDYWNEHNKDKVGSWAGNLIETSYDKPEGYSEVFIDFREG